MKSVPLRRVATILNGGTPTVDEINWGGDVPWATPVDLGRADGLTIAATDRTLTDEGLRSGSTQAPSEAVIVSTRAPIGYTARATLPMAFNQGCKAVVGGQGVDARYLQLALMAVISALKAAGSGSTFLELSSEALASQPISMTSLAQQRRIADFLDDRVGRIDRIIAARREQVGLVRESARCDSARLFASGGDGWKAPRIAHVFRTGSGSTPPSEDLAFYDGDVPWVNTGDIKDAPIGTTKRSITAKALTEFSTLVCYPPGSLVIAMYGQGATKGRVGLLDAPATVNQACCVLQGDSELTEWAFHWFRTHKLDVVALAMGAGQPNLSQDIVRNIRMPFPPHEERSHILRALTSVEVTTGKMAAVIARSIDLLTEYKSSLITAAVTGELDVTTAGSGIPA